MANTVAAQEVLDGVYTPEKDEHQGTLELFEEIARIRDVLPADSVVILVRHPLWQKKWKKKQEKTSSLELGLHFGHYIAGADSDVISHCHTLPAHCALRRGYSPARWEPALSCMLETIVGCLLVVDGGQL
jgi:hypothetical protein